MKKILILGGSHRDIPLIKASQELGYFVITLGDRDYYLGHNYSNKVYKVNFNDLDKVREIIKKENIDFLIPGSGEESYLNTVFLSQEFNIGNFDTYETAKLIHNKWKFKEFCLKNNISTPNGKFYKKEENLDNLTYPIVVKPTNLSGGRGVDVVYNQKELKISLSKAKDISNEIFLEEYIEGNLIAYSIFLKDQKILYSFSGEDRSYLNKYLITTAYPIKLHTKVQQKINNDIQKIAKLLNLVNGMFHFQILIRDNTPYIIDVTRRIPGDFYPYLIEYADKVKYSHSVIKAYTKGKIDNEFKNKNTKQKFIIRHVIMANKNGNYRSLKIDNILKNKIIFEFNILKSGDEIKSYLNTQIGIIFIQLDNYDKNVVNNLNKLIKVEIG